jgi:prolyl-tRNA editing enzyme YbaK/EbsC (Cys-tRNA(Pro) deacylase)
MRRDPAGEQVVDRMTAAAARHGSDLPRDIIGGYHIRPRLGTTSGQVRADGNTLMKPASSTGAKRIQAVLGDAFSVLEFDQSTHSSAAAAEAIGSDVAQIAKSMLFRAADGRPVLVVTSGSNRVDEKKVAALLGQKIKRAEADFVLAHTGAEPGGVPPVGHTTAPETFLDRDLQAYGTIWAAGGSTNSVFALTPDDLARITGAIFADVAK